MSLFTMVSTLRFTVFLLNSLQSNAVERSTTYLKTPCVLFKSEIRLSKGHENSVKWRCEISDDNDDDDTEPYIFSMEPDWSPVLDLNETITETIVSGLTTFFAPGCLLDWDRFAVIIPPDSVAELETPASARNGARNGDSKTTGFKKVLVVRVVASDTKTTASPAKIADEWFGTGTNEVNLRSKYQQCSYGKLIFNPAPDKPEMGIKNGVVTVKIDLVVRANVVDDMVILNKIHTALKEKLGMKYKYDYDHIAVCFPRAKRNWKAFSYVGGKFTGYDDNICLAVSYQMHEIGHNLMLSQSGIIGNEDGDTSSTMGFSVNEDNTNRCFNAPKNWLMGWYADRHKLLNPLQTPEFLGRLVGLSQYRKTVARDYVIVKIVGTNKNDIYVSLNTATGINSDTGMGRNKVLITLTETEDASSKSTLVKELNAGQSHSIKNFGGTGKTLDIHVYEITNPKRSPLPQFARIGVKLMPFNDNKHIRFVYGKKKRSCSTMPVKYCNKVDDNGRIMRNYCHAKCNSRKAKKMP